MHAGTRYVPCNKLATYIVKTSDPKAYTMCSDCAAHSIKHRGAKILQHGMKYVLATDEDFAGQRNLPNTTTELVDDLEPADNEVKSEDLAAVINICRDQVRLQRAVDKAANDLEKLQGDLDANIQSLLPKAMKQAGVPNHLPLDGGAYVDLVTIVKARIPSLDKDPDKNAVGLAYVDKVAPDLPKTVLTIEFGRGEEKDLKKMLADLRARKKPLAMQVARTVHAGTLTKWVKEREKDGGAIDEQALSVHRFEMAEVKLPKVKKPLT